MTFGSELIAAAKEAVAIARDEADPATYNVHLLPPDVEIDVGAIRRRLGMTQSAFATAYGFTPGTVRDWEQGRVRPDTAARSYLLVIEARPDVRDALRRNLEARAAALQSLEIIADGHMRTRTGEADTTAETIVRTSREIAALDQANALLVAPARKATRARRVPKGAEKASR